MLDVVADKPSRRSCLLKGELALGGELRDVTVLFCDIRGFTGHTEHMPPATVIALLNEHMTALTAIVHEHGGIVDKFVGDALMAIFGAPEARPHAAEDAVRAAARMLEARARLNAASPSTRSTIGIGIASGEVIVGCMGSAPA